MGIFCAYACVGKSKEDDSSNTGCIVMEDDAAMPCRMTAKTAVRITLFTLKEQKKKYMHTDRDKKKKTMNNSTK